MHDYNKYARAEYLIIHKYYKFATISQNTFLDI